MADWLEELGPSEQEGWHRFVDHVRRDAVGKIDESAFVISLVPGKPDIKFAVELGLAIMYDKPILAVVAPGAQTSEHLRRVADLIVEADLDLEEGREALQRAIEQFSKEHGE